jgi:hypothetical protein
VEISGSDPWPFIIGNDPEPVGCFLWACVPSAYSVTLTNPDGDSHSANCNLLVVVGYQERFDGFGNPVDIVRIARVFAYGIDDPDSAGVGRSGLLLASMFQAVDPDEECFASFDISADDPTTTPTTTGGQSASADPGTECDQQVCGPGCPTDCTDCCDDLCFTFSNGARGGFTKTPDDGCRYAPATGASAFADNIALEISCRMYGQGDWIWIATFSTVDGYLASTVNAPCPPLTPAGWGNPVLPGGVTLTSVTCAACADTCDTCPDDGCPTCPDTMLVTLAGSSGCDDSWTVTRTSGCTWAWTDGEGSGVTVSCLISTGEPAVTVNRWQVEIVTTDFITVRKSGATTGCCPAGTYDNVTLNTCGGTPVVTIS